MIPDWGRRLDMVRAALCAGRRARQRKAGNIEEADAARRRSDWSTAIALYRAYLELHPRDLTIQLRLIRTFFAAGLLDEGEAALAEARRERPDRANLATLAAQFAAAREASVPLLNYDRFRRNLQLPAPPPLPDHREVTAVVDGRNASRTLIDLTLASLKHAGCKKAFVCTGKGDRPPASETGQLVLVLGAGVTVDATAIAWLHHALVATGAVAAYGDDDRARVGDGGTTTYADPAFYSAPHPLDLATTPRLPAAVLLNDTFGPALPAPIDPFVVLQEAFTKGTVAHIPLLLATDRAARDRPSVSVVSCDGPRARIEVIIPTRDEAGALSVMIESLLVNATHLSDLEVIVVDNGSRAPETLSLLASMTRTERVRVVTANQPFNWSRLNNLAAAGSSADILLFANNDMKMLTPGWDERLRRHLSYPGVDLVGARLVYPSRSIQHAGVVLGAMGDHLVHDGLGAAASEPGPLDRWRRTRPAAAVTGAFMAVRRDAYERAGGFDEAFPIGCNDIDFCLRIRRQGGLILYAADLELIHAESLSRGHDDTEARRKRADDERAELFRIWGPEAGRDPSRNPHWVNHKTLLFYGVRQPTMKKVEEWMRRSVDAWSVAQHTPQPVEGNPSPR